MISIRNSPASEASPHFAELPRQSRENNLAWLARAESKRRYETQLILLGGRSAAHLRLRVAQSHARGDLTPSHWSHLLLSLDQALQHAYHIPLCDPGRNAFPPETNGVQEVALKEYSDFRAYPNIAVISVPAKADAVQQALDRFRHERAAMDAVELLVLWLAFLWGVGKAGNPLLDGQGIPSAAMAEYVLGAVGIDLTPGLGSRSSCPEAIWQSAKWWHTYHQREEGDPLTGAWTLGHKLVP